MSTSGTSRDSLRRNKLDHTENVRTDYYKTNALNSHRRPHTLIPDLRKPDRVLPRPNTAVL